MRELYKFESKEKECFGGIRNTQDRNQIESFAGDSGAISALQNTEKAEKSQCLKCKPPLVFPKGGLKLCADCRAEETITATTLLANFRRHRKVWILDRECDSCRKPKTGAMMMRRQNVCRSCFSKMMQTNGATRNRMIAGAVNCARRNDYLRGWGISFEITHHNILLFCLNQWNRTTKGRALNLI